MNLVDYLLDIYGFGTPIFLKDVRIGRKSKTAIREEFYRAYKRGDITRDGPGVYSIVNKSNEIKGTVTFEKILSAKYLYSDDCNEILPDLFIEGYYSGLTFLNMIGISQQVPATLEITTNKVGSKKYLYKALGRTAIIRKARAKVTFQNYRILQFLDMFSFLSRDEVKENKDLISNYVKKAKLDKTQLKNYLGLYDTSTIKKIVEEGII